MGPQAITDRAKRAHLVSASLAAGQMVDDDGPPAWFQRVVNERGQVSGEATTRVRTRSDHVSTPRYRERSPVGWRWANAVRNCARPRWMRERTVPSFTSSTSLISS